jgi:hypothetical protein
MGARSATPIFRNLGPRRKGSMERRARLSE